MGLPVVFWRFPGQPVTADCGDLCKPGNGVGREQAGFRPKKGTINALWLGASGSVAA